MSLISLYTTQQTLSAILYNIEYKESMYVVIKTLIGFCNRWKSNSY